VGYLVRQDRAPIVFALHAEAASYGGIRTFRREMAERLLSDVTAQID
jgi:beta-lactamase class D